MGQYGGADLCFMQPSAGHQPKLQDHGYIVHRMVCPFTPQLSLVLINWPLRDGMLSWQWHTAAEGWIWTWDFAILSPAPYHMVQTVQIIDC